MKLFLSAALLLTLTHTLYSEVYLLAPLRQRGGKYIPAPAELSNGTHKPMFTTPVEVNGRKFDLEVYRFKESFAAFIKQLRTRYPQAVFHEGKDFLRVTFTGGKSGREHWLFTGSGFHNGVTGFRLPGADKLDRAVWSRELPPLPVDGNAEMVIKLPKLNGTFGSFSGTAQDPERALASYSAMLRSLRSTFAIGISPSGRQNYAA